MPAPAATLSAGVAARIAHCLPLAATPTFALMAAFAALDRSDLADSLCSSRAGFHPAGMAAMYGLMSLFHAAPWLRRLTRR
jgi:hypothetical protein